MGMESDVMEFFINDVAVKRDSGGVYTVLESVYKSASANNGADSYTFLLGDVAFNDNHNVKVIKNMAMQKSYLRRIFFDWFSGAAIISKSKPDVYISMQNTAQIGLKKIPQFTYLHQPLPFQRTKKFSIFKKKERKMAFYQYVVGALIKGSLKFSNTKVIVQSQWLKNELVVRGLAKPNDIFVSFPKVKKISQIYQEQIVETEKVVFFFPSTAMVYKNHKVILEALSLLPKDIKRKIQIIFTLTESELINLTEIKSIPEEIVLTGRVNKQEVAEILSRSILIFPSYIETFGLPILEAKQIERPLIVADVPVLRESVSDYEDVQYFNPFDSRHLANIISDFVKNRTITRSVGFDEESGINTKLDNLLTLVKGEMSRHAKN